MEETNIEKKSNEVRNYSKNVLKKTLEILQQEYLIERNKRERIQNRASLILSAVTMAYLLLLKEKGFNLIQICFHCITLYELFKFIPFLASVILFISLMSMTIEILNVESHLVIDIGKTEDNLSKKENEFLEQHISNYLGVLKKFKEISEKKAKKLRTVLSIVKIFIIVTLISIVI